MITSFGVTLTITKGQETPTKPKPSPHALPSPYEFVKAVVDEYVPREITHEAKKAEKANKGSLFGFG